MNGHFFPGEGQKLFEIVTFLSPRTKNHHGWGATDQKLIDFGWVP
jgi:hypothetical protein